MLQFAALNLSPLNCRWVYFPIIERTRYFLKCTQDQYWLVKLSYCLSRVNASVFLISWYWTRTQSHATGQRKKYIHSLRLLTTENKMGVVGTLKSRISKRFFYRKHKTKAAQKDHFSLFKTLLWELTKTPKGSSQQIQRDGTEKIQVTKQLETSNRSLRLNDLFPPGYFSVEVHLILQVTKHQQSKQ